MALRLLSYQGMMAVFNQFVVGSFQKQSDGNTVTNTTILRTVSPETEELDFLRAWNVSDGTTDLQILVANSTAKAFQGLASKHILDTRSSLKSTLEELFRNFTISLLAEPYFQ